MKKFAAVSCLLLLFTLTTGAAIIDKETKQGVLSLRDKTDRYAQQQVIQNQETQTLLKEVLERLRSRQKPIIVEVPRIVEKIVERPLDIASTPLVSQAPANVTVTLPDDLRNQMIYQMRGNQSMIQTILVMVVFCFILVLALLVKMKKAEERIRGVFWKSEMDGLRQGVGPASPVRAVSPAKPAHPNNTPTLPAAIRPLLKVRTEEGRIELINSGEAMADDIRVYAGTAPSTMKHRLRTSERMQAGAVAEVNFQSLQSSGQVYVNVEYKNPQSGKIYKDQFLVAVDQGTGRMLPVQQAS